MRAPSNLLNVDRSELITICIYSHARWIGNLIARTCYTLQYSLHRSRDETGVVTNRGIWWAKKK